MRSRLVRLPSLLLWLCLAIPPGCAADDAGDGGDGEDESDAGGDARTGRDDLDGGGGGGGDGDTAPTADTSLTPDDHSGTPDVVEPACGGADEACCAGGACDNGLDCLGAVCAAITSQCPGIPACLEPAAGPIGVPVTMRTGEPPLLAGGTVSNGSLELDSIDVYADYTFSDLVESVDVTSNGNTSGLLEFLGPDWGFGADLDLYIDIIAIGMDFGQPFQQVLGAGGCFTVDDSYLVSDLSECGASWPEGSDPPDSLEFETTANGMRFLLILTRDALLASVPPADQFAAGLAIEGDLPVLFTFSRVE